MDSIILIAILCTVVGLLSGVILLNYFKGKAKDNVKDKPKTKTKSKSSQEVKMVEQLPMEFSKKILIASYIIAVAVIIYTMYIVHLMVVGDYTGDPSSLNTLIMLTLGELGAANSFYFWKAKSENISKLNSIHDNGNQITEEDII